MRKLICDKCGKEIDTSYMDKYDIHPSAMCRIFDKKLNGTGGPIIDESNDLEYELCEDCTNQLVTFLKG
jgi:protein-arginine kinase activator protein McsA